jgi:hypothetical protein
VGWRVREREVGWEGGDGDRHQNGEVHGWCIACEKREESQVLWLACFLDLTRPWKEQSKIHLRKMEKIQTQGPFILPFC